MVRSRISSSGESAMSKGKIGGVEEEKTPEEQLEQVKLLFDYTKFHIGLYTTLAGVLVATLGSKFATHWQVCRPLIGLAVLFIALAGLAGGVIASSLPYLTRRVSNSNLFECEIGPLWSDRTNGKKSMLAQPLRYWTYLEHLSFWIAIVLVLIAFAPKAFT
jgi:hypothetical protein